MPQEGKLSHSERLELIKTIGRLPSAQFEQLICALDMPPENKPGGSAVKGDKAFNLIDWAESPIGPGLVEFQGVLARVTGQSVGSSDSPPGASFTENLGSGIKLEMIYISGGVFRMGSPEGEGINGERPQHLVTAASFWMGKYSVTQAQWKVVAGFAKVERCLTLTPAEFKGGNRPVEGVTWDEAVEFCARLSNHSGKDYRLPSEAEWEYACRAGTITPYYFGKTISKDVANYGGHHEGTTEVGRLQPNAFSLYDMHGNVYEWCLDYWHENYLGAPTDGSARLTGGNDSYRVIRGGSWFSNPRNCRTAYRSRTIPDLRLSQIGFRVCCSAPRTP